VLVRDVAEHLTERAHLLGGAVRIVRLGHQLGRFEVKHAKPLVQRADGIDASALVVLFMLREGERWRRERGEQGECEWA
jgi:hypothetical protein